MRPGREFSRLRLGEVRWELLPGMEENLLYLLEELARARGGDSPRSHRFERRGERIIKVKTNRPSLPAELFIKVSSPQGIRQLWEGKFHLGSAGRQWRMAFEHRKRGLPVPNHLAWGLKRHRGRTLEQYLIEESLAGFEPLDEFLSATFLPDLPGSRPEDKRHLIQELARLIRTMHDRGVVRTQFEPMNIMAAPRSGGGVKFVFVDLDRSRLRPPRRLKDRERTRELARFHKNFARLFSQSYRIRLYREYFAPDRLSREEFRERVKKIVLLAGRLAQEEEKKVVRAVARREPPFFWFEGAGRRVFLRKPLYQNAVIELADKLSAGEKIARVRVKRTGGEPPLELLVTTAGPAGRREREPAGERGFVMSALLEHHGLPHFRVMAAMDAPGQGSWLLTTAPGRGDYNLAEYLARKVAEDFSGLSWDRKFLVRTARFILALHELGFYFPDPAGDDIWVRTTDLPTLEFRLLNLHKLRRLRSGRPEDRLQNLFDWWRVLPISQSDGMMLAEEYLRFCPRLAPQRKVWLKKYLEWQIGSASPREDKITRQKTIKK